MGDKLKELLQKETVFCISAVLALGSSFVIPPSAEYLNYLDYKTLALLFCLMSVVAGLQSIGAFNSLGVFILKKARGTRSLGILLVTACFFSSMLITNDVALITFVPFTILVYRMIDKEERLIKIVVLETIAANLGSMATPVGNPQNLYLYSISQISAGEFFKAVLPYAALSLVLLLIVLCFEKNRYFIFTEAEDSSETAAAVPARSKKLYAYGIMFLGCLLVVAHLIPWQAALALVFLWMLFGDRQLLGKVDYYLLLTFVCFFIFIGNMKQIEWIRAALQNLIQGQELFTGILASQVISNVPAAILLSGFTQEYSTLLVAVNLGGLGTLIASLASLISFKAYTKEYEQEKGRYFIQFTLWNVVFLVILTAAACVFGV